MLQMQAPPAQPEQAASTKPKPVMVDGEIDLTQWQSDRCNSGYINVYTNKRNNKFEAWSMQKPVCVLSLYFPRSVQCVFTALLPLNVLNVLLVWPLLSVRCLVALSADCAHYVPQRKPKQYIAAFDTAEEAAMAVARSFIFSVALPPFLHLLALLRSLVLSLGVVRMFWRISYCPDHTIILADLSSSLSTYLLHYP